MTVSEPASFLNLDLELNSSANLSRLAKHLNGSAFILYNGRIKDAYRLCAEPVIRGSLSKSPRACTAHFLEVLENLPEPLARVLERCKNRAFDYGFDGGLESKPISVKISKAHLARIALLGIEVRITIYPHRSGSEA